MKKLLIIALASTVLLASCNKTPEEVLGALEIQFAGQVLQAAVAGVEPMVQNLEWATDDRIGIYMIKADPGTLATEYILVENRQLAAIGGATTSFFAIEGGPMLFPTNPDESIRFIAYRPFSENITSDFRLPIDLSDQSDLSKLQVLYVPITNSFNRTRSGAIPLEFRPQLTKLVLNITNGPGVNIPVENGLEIRISGQPTQGYLSLIDGTVSSSNIPSEVVIFSTGEGTTVTAEAMVFPGSTAGIQFTIINEIGQEFVVNLPSQTWQNSTLYTYSISLTIFPSSSGVPSMMASSSTKTNLVGVLR